VLNNFNKDDRHIKLMAQMLQNLFPSINVTTVSLSSIRRVCLFHYNDAEDVIGA
jgi:ribosome biogenesis protein SSF1/2